MKNDEKVLDFEKWIEYLRENSLSLISKLS